MSNISTQHIWDNFSRVLRRFLLSQVACAHDADDLLQEIFIKIHLKHHTLSKGESLPAWVWQITRNTLLDYHKKRRMPLATVEQAESIAVEITEQEVNQLMAACIRPYLDLLPSAQREALQLADLENMSQKLLAEKWGVSHSGAKSRVQRARTELHGLFQQCCHVKADAYGNIIYVECWEK
jgi:RNA polymerase sigma-70 factor (ECF subfamily)